MPRQQAGAGQPSAWEGMIEEVFTRFHEWRLQHPRATFKEIETALKEHLARVWARLLAAAALASAAADLLALERADLLPEQGDL